MQSPTPKPPAKQPATGVLNGAVYTACREAVRIMTRIPVATRWTIVVMWDVASWLLAMLVVVGLRYDFSLNETHWLWVLGYTVVMVGLQLVGGLVTHAYLGRHRTGSFGEATWLGAFILVIAIPSGVVLGAVAPGFPRTVGVMLPPLALLIMTVGRGVYRTIFSIGQRRTSVTAEPVLIYGAGNAGHQIAQMVDIAAEPPYSIVGYVDDDPRNRYHRVLSYKVLGTGDDLVAMAQKMGAGKVIVAISDASADLLGRVSSQCKAADLEVVVIPPLREMIDGQFTLGSLREFNVADLLGRRPIKTDLEEIADYIAGRVVLITGAGGSIGSELSRQVSRLGPTKLVLLDRDESALHSVELAIYGSGLLNSDDLVLCSIRDYRSLQRVFEHHRPEVVFHAAALKHLPLLERFPEEGWQTNVLGTLNVLRCAHEAGVDHLVNISTDKAADPSSVLGRTKRMAERLTAWYAARYDLRYLSVRFGNVLGSRGSVLFTFRAQIEQGGPVTVTDPDVTRYFMTIPEACELVLQAGAIGQPADVLVLDMGEPVRILDVAERLIAESKRDIEVQFTGLREGEKMHEVLFSGEEAGVPSDHPLINRVSVPSLDPGLLPSTPRNKEEMVELLESEPSIPITRLTNHADTGVSVA